MAPNAASTPSFICRPSSLAGPLNGAAMPKRISLSVTPLTAGPRAASETGVAAATVTGAGAAGLVGQGGRRRHRHGLHRPRHACREPRCGRRRGRVVDELVERDDPERGYDA